MLEEAAFRGIVFGGFKRRCTATVSVVVSSAVFAVAHGVPILMPYLAALGVALAVLYEWHRTLWAPIIAHAMLNGVVSLPLFLAVVS